MPSGADTEKAEITSGRYPAFRQHFDRSSHADHLVDRRLSQNEEVRFYRLVQPPGLYRSPLSGTSCSA